PGAVAPRCRRAHRTGDRERPRRPGAAGALRTVGVGPPRWRRHARGNHPAVGRRPGPGPRRDRPSRHQGGRVMAGGTYSALSGLRTRLAQLDRIAADIANAGTAGYKTERVPTVEARRPDFNQVLQTA